MCVYGQWSPNIFNYFLLLYCQNIINVVVRKYLSHYPGLHIICILYNNNMYTYKRPVLSVTYRYEI